MQPVQLSLIEELAPPPPGAPVGELPAEALAEAVAALMAKAVSPPEGRAGDE